MKNRERLAWVAMSGVLVTALAVTQVGETASAGTCATENGDINGDGGRDLGDAIALLNWLFANGPEPEPICPPIVTVGLPDTGASQCFDNSWAPTDCSNGAAPAGQDATYSTGCADIGRFVDNPDGTVTDLCTGLMWEQGSGAPNSGAQWDEALQYCEDLELAGHSDWRLPNVRELESIVNYGTTSPAAYPEFNSSPSFYWSSTTAEHATSNAWAVYFLSGGIGDAFKQLSFKVRAVRTVQP